MDCRMELWGEDGEKDGERMGKILFDIWQNKYSYVKFKNKIKLKKKDDKYE